MPNIINNLNIMSDKRYRDLNTKSANEIYVVENINKKILNKILDIRYKEFGGANWVRIYHHNCKGGTLFFTSNNAKFNLDKDRYSLLGSIDSFERYDSTKYEFLLEYPEAGSTYYNRWSQTSNPVTNTGISGYTAIDIHMTAQNWGGLSISSSNTSTFLDGSPSATTWFYAIAPYVVWGGGVPAFDGSVGQQKITLWLRVK